MGRRRRRSRTNNQWSAGDAQRYPYLRDLGDRGRAELDKAGQVSQASRVRRIVGGGDRCRQMMPRAAADQQ